MEILGPYGRVPRRGLFNWEISSVSYVCPCVVGHHLPVKADPESALA